MYVDIAEHRLTFAKDCGATYAMRVDTKDTKQMAQKIIDEMGAMPDITIECSGAEASVQTAIYVSEL